MGVDTDMWLRLTAEKKKARHIMMKIVGEWDPILETMRQWDKGCLYGVTVSMHEPVQYDRWGGKMAVTIEAHTGKGIPPFETAARQLLERYPDCELEGIISNDCCKMHKYDRFDERSQCYEFHVCPGDWEAFLDGRYEDTTQGVAVIAAGEIADEASQTEPEGEPDQKEINDPLPF